MRVNEAKVALRTRTTDPVWARQLIELTQETKRGYMEQLGKRGSTFASKFDRLISDLPVSDTEWATMPMNYVLWLYALGCGSEDHRRLFTELGHAYVLGCKAKDTELAVSKADMPLSAIGRALLAKSEKTFRLPRDRTFARLNMALTGLCFAVFGKSGKSESQRVSEALVSAAPLFRDVLTDTAGSDGDAAGPHTASVSDINPITSTMLFTTVPVKTCRMLLRVLFERVRPLYRIETQEISREEFVANMLTYINVSIFGDPEQSRRTSFAFSDTYLW